MKGVFKMVKVGQNGGVSDVPPRGDGNNTQQASQSKNKPNCVFEVKGEGSFVTSKNGIFDEIYDKVYEYEDDENGNMIKESYDFDSDGKLDEIREYEYDENGNRIKSSYDKNADGKLDEIHEYDENGKLIKSSYGFDSDGKHSITEYGV